MRKIFCIFILLVQFILSFSQKSVSYYRTIEYFDKTDSAKNYAVFYRPNGPAKKMLILLTGFGESPQIAEIETNIPEIAASKGILTAIICNTDGSQSFSIDGNAQHYLDSIIPLLLTRNNIPNDAYYIGGFSLGGTSAIKYVQHCNIYDIQPMPKAVFTIDPPLDFVRMHKIYEHWKNDTSKWYNTNKPLYTIYLDKMHTFFKGNLNDAFENYVNLSPYCYEDSNNYGARLFGKMPLLTYCEPDIDWAMNEKRWNLYELNLADNVGFINELKQLGNTNTSLILTKGKGYRKVLKYKQPHSWSIADANEVVKWLLKF